MTDRLKKTVLLGSLLNPTTLFTTLPEPLRTRCQRAFASGRAETLESQVLLGITPPGLPRQPLRPFTGRAYDDEHKPTPEYIAHWRAFYDTAETKQAQVLARSQIVKSSAGSGVPERAVDLEFQRTTGRFIDKKEPVL